MIFRFRSLNWLFRKNISKCSYIFALWPRPGDNHNTVPTPQNNRKIVWIICRFHAKMSPFYVFAPSREFLCSNSPSDWYPRVKVVEFACPQSNGLVFLLVSRLYLDLEKSFLEALHLSLLYLISSENSGKYKRWTSCNGTLHEAHQKRNISLLNICVLLILVIWSAGIFGITWFPLAQNSLKPYKHFICERL